MNQVLSVLKIREVKIQCSICGTHFITKVFPNRTYKGGNCFRSIGRKSAKDESWECDSCWDKPIAVPHSLLSRSRYIQNGLTKY